eukprot:2925958-Lingulodinium_polyedra.AAC.1
MGERAGGRKHVRSASSCSLCWQEHGGPLLRRAIAMPMPKCPRALAQATRNKPDGERFADSGWARW